MRNTKVFDTKQEKYLTIKIRPLMDGNTETTAIKKYDEEN